MFCFEPRVPRALDDLIDLLSRFLRDWLLVDGGDFSTVEPRSGGGFRFLGSCVPMDFVAVEECVFRGGGGVPVSSDLLSLCDRVFANLTFAEGVSSAGVADSAL